MPVKVISPRLQMDNAGDAAVLHPTFKRLGRRTPSSQTLACLEFNACRRRSRFPGRNGLSGDLARSLITMPPAGKGLPQGSKKFGPGDEARLLPIEPEFYETPSGRLTR